MLSTQLSGCSVVSLRSVLLPVSYAASFYSSLVVPAVLYLSICCGYVEVCLYVQSSCSSLAALTNCQQGRGHKSITCQTMTYDHALVDILLQCPY
jgi:hypothetical protein